MNQQLISFFINIYEKKIVSVKISNKSFEEKKFFFFCVFSFQGGGDKKNNFQIFNIFHQKIISQEYFTKKVPKKILDTSNFHILRRVWVREIWILKHNEKSCRIFFKKLFGFPSFDTFFVFGKKTFFFLFFRIFRKNLEIFTTLVTKVFSSARN